MFCGVNELRRGESGTVRELRCTGALRRRIIDMGVTPGAVLTLRKAAPFGDPLQLNVRGYELSIRLSEARQIMVERISYLLTPSRKVIADEIQDTI